MSRYDLLTCWPWKFVNIKRHVVKVCAKFERNRAISGWVIDNFATSWTRYGLGHLYLELLQHFGCHVCTECIYSLDRNNTVSQAGTPKHDLCVRLLMHVLCII